MLTFHTGSSGQAMAEYLAEVISLDGNLAAVPRMDISPGMAAVLGINPGRALSIEEMGNLLSGLRADGNKIVGKQQHKNGIAYIDLTFTAPKSFSIALAFAPTKHERDILERAHINAVQKTMTYIAGQISSPQKRRDHGQIGWVSFDHHIARPTAKVAGSETTELVSVPVVGDPNRHTHVIVPSVVATSNGVYALDTKKFQKRIHEFGAIYQGFLSAELQRQGVKVELDHTTWMAHLPAVPKMAVDLYSKRSRDGELAARRMAEKYGKDWDTMTPEARVKFLRYGSYSERNPKIKTLGDQEEWRRQAREAGYNHKSVLGDIRPLGSNVQRRWRAYEASLHYMEEQLEHRSRFRGDLARVAAAKGFIHSGMVDPAQDIREVRNAYISEGVRQNGQMTPLVWSKLGDDHFASFTTDMHIQQEIQAIELIEKGARDKSAALSPAAVERAIKAERQLDFTTESGIKQREIIDRIAAGGRTFVAIGVAGSGKTTVLRPLIRAWKEDGRDVYGTTLAWRQTVDLEEAGIGKGAKRKQRFLEPDTRYAREAGLSEDRTMALATFLKRAGSDQIVLSRNSVVVIDEIAQVGTHQVLQLLRLQKQHEFQIVALGDHKQCQAIEAGNTVRLFEKAMGDNAIPELLTTVRQQTERERETSLMFRDGKAAEALKRKDEDGTLRIVPGGYDKAVIAAVDLLEQRKQANTDPDYTIGISAPTNADARKISEEIRRRRLPAMVRQTTVPAIDQIGATYDLKITETDRLRLFNRANAKFSDGKWGTIGVNGSVVEVMGIQKEGLLLKNHKGAVGLVKWETVTDRKTQRIKLTYGDALTIDSAQGITLSEHIVAMPAGSEAVHAFKAYSAGSRHRMQSWIVTSQGAEIEDIQNRKAEQPLGLNTDPEEMKKAVLANMARNLSRDPEKILATDMLDAATVVKQGTVAAGRASWTQTGNAAVLSRGNPPPNSPPPPPQVRTQAAPRAPVATSQHPPATPLPVPDVPPPQGHPRASRTRADAMSEAVRSRARPPDLDAIQPRPGRRINVISETEAQAEFADAIHRAGLRIEGPPKMDGKAHYAALEGAKGGRKAAWYVGHYDEHPAGVIGNFQTGERIPWRASAPTIALDPEARRRRDEERERVHQAAEAERLAQQENASRKANAAWDRAQPAATHPYTSRKKMEPEGLRVNIRNELLVPMRDADGKMWNVQGINEAGEKRFLPHGRKKGLFHILGVPREGENMVVAEGYATAKSIRDSTALTTVIAFDGGNLRPVADALRSKYPRVPLVFGADNDEHLTRRNPPLPNTGVRKAHEAAQGDEKIVIPPHVPEHQDTDWNDYALRYGKHELRARFAEAGVVRPIPEVSQEQRDAARLRAEATKPTTQQQQAWHRQQNRNNRDHNPDR